MMIVFYFFLNKHETRRQRNNLQKILNIYLLAHYINQLIYLLTLG
jgi:hypothetical protein